MKTTKKVQRSDSATAPVFNAAIEDALKEYSRYGNKEREALKRAELGQLNPTYLVDVSSWLEQKLITAKNILDGKVSIEWQTGGLSSRGYNYDQEQHALSAETEPEFDVMDRILEEIWPSITYLQYKVLTREAFSQSSRSESDYYGGHTDYAIKALDLYKFWQYLQIHRT